VSNELTHESFVVLKGDHPLVLVARSGLLELYPLLNEPLDPEADRAGQNRERSYGNLPTALPPAASIRPREKRENASGPSLLITEVKVIGRGIVEVYRTFDQSKPENTGVEVEIPLWVTGDPGDVMDPGTAETHRPDSCLAFLGSLALVAARTGSATLTAVAALMLGRMRRDVLGIGLSGARTGIAVSLLRTWRTLFLLSSGCHYISNLDPSIKATAMPFAEAVM